MFQSIKNSISRNIKPDSSQIRVSDWEVLSKYWYPVARLQDVRKKPLARLLLDVQLAIFRTEDGIAAVLDRCPHRWVKLSAGKVVNGNLECAYHALQFSGSGQCEHIPGALKAEGSTQMPRSYRVESFSVKVKFGLVWVCLDDTGEMTLPELPGVEDNKLLFVEPITTSCSAQRQIENFFDLGHLPVVHQPSLGGKIDKPITPGKVTTLKDGGVQMIAEYEEIPNGEDVRSVTYTHRVTLPFVADLTINDEHGDARFINITTPTSAFECTAYQILIDTSDAGDHHANVIEMTNQVNDEDKYILENTPQVSIRLDGRGEIHMAIDNFALAYRKALLDSGLGQ